MRRSSYSLATLLLLISIAAVSAASIRAALASVLWGTPAVPALKESTELVLGLMVAGAVVGGLLGLVLAAWNLSPALAGVGRALGGLLLGAAAAAQLTVKVDWQVIFAAPIVLVAAAALVAATRRRLSKRSELVRA